MAAAERDREVSGQGGASHWREADRGPTPPDGVALAVEGLNKAYDGAVALVDVSLKINHGEVRAVVGKNGAGKSTLVKILTGAVRPDGGHIVVAGREAKLSSPAAASAHGIAGVHQEFALVPELTVTENITLGLWGKGIIRRSALERLAAQVLDDLGSAIDLNAKVRSLRIAEQQIVEIAKGLARKPALLILDEPTAALSPRESSALLEVVARLSEQGVAVMYVSHRLQEIPMAAHSVSVLRDGRLVDTLPIAKASSQRLVAMMVGDTARVTHVSTPAAVESPRVPVMEVRNLTVGSVVQRVSFDLHRGEILGLAGQLGSGPWTVLRAIYGLEKSSGTVTVNGTNLLGLPPRKLIKHGIGLVPEDRKREGTVASLSVRDNLILPSLGRLSSFGFWSGQQGDVTARAVISQLSIKTPSLNTPVVELSGGNQQKVIIGRCLVAECQILLLNEPTRGVDIDAKEQIYASLSAITAQGASALFVPSEFDELFRLCDRILIFRHGSVVEERRTADTTTAELLSAVSTEA